MAGQHPENQRLARIQTVFSVYGKRADAMSPLRNILPPGKKIFGLVTSDDPETSLWRPFGSRRLLHVTLKDSAEEIRARGIEYILVNGEVVKSGGDAGVESWLLRVNGSVVQKVPLRYRASREAFDWYLVRLNDRTAHP